jgi:hypothetical protein
MQYDRLIAKVYTMAFDRLALLTTRAFAESPSASSLGMPRIFDLLVPSVFFRFFCLKLAQERRLLTIPDLATAIVK